MVFWQSSTSRVEISFWANSLNYSHYAGRRGQFHKTSAMQSLCPSTKTKVKNQTAPTTET